MELESAPVYRVPGAQAVIERVADAMKLLCAFPSHEQAPSWRREIDAVKDADPEIHTMALAQTLPLFANRDRIIRGEEVCPRCHGTAVLRWGGRDRVCGCPTGEKSALSSVQILNPTVFQVEEQIPLFAT